MDQISIHGHFEIASGSNVFLEGDIYDAIAKVATNTGGQGFRILAITSGTTILDVHGHFRHIFDDSSINLAH
jgi:hypothetical protein